MRIRGCCGLCCLLLGVVNRWDNVCSDFKPLPAKLATLGVFHFPRSSRGLESFYRSARMPLVERLGQLLFSRTTTQLTRPLRHADMWLTHSSVVVFTRRECAEGFRQPNVARGTSIETDKRNVSPSPTVSRTAHVAHPDCRRRLTRTLGVPSWTRNRSFWYVLSIVLLTPRF